MLNDLNPNPNPNKKININVNIGVTTINPCTSRLTGRQTCALEIHQTLILKTLLKSIIA